MPINQLLAFNSSLYRLMEENTAFAKSVPAGGMVLDAGAGDCTYRHLFAHAKYESADIQSGNSKHTYTCDLKNLPVEDGRFEYVLFNQVMMYIEPVPILKELNRVLKPGGKVMYTGPLFYEDLGEHDMFRFTQYGLRQFFTAAGFEIERFDWLEGYFGTVGYQLSCMSRYLPWKPDSFGNAFLGLLLMPGVILLKLGCSAASVLFHRLETRVKFKAAGHPKNYVVIARKLG
jgi:SAM-dependent methyltransferase